MGLLFRMTQNIPPPVANRNNFPREWHAVGVQTAFGFNRKFRMQPGPFEFVAERIDEGVIERSICADRHWDHSKRT
jgi:hypothetical protein